MGCWSGPPPAHNSLEAWQRLKDAHFTFCGPTGGYTAEQNRRKLDFCQQVGLKALVVDSRIHPTMTAHDGWQENVAQVVAEFSDHAALYGYYVVDEPNYVEFPALGEIVAELKRRDTRRLAYINLFPTYASVKQLGTPTYADHLDKFLSIVRPQVLSYDHYCLLKGGRDRPDYFENLGLVRAYAQRYNTPPWNVILSTPHLAYRDPTAGEMRWQVYTSLACGMKGIMWYTYWSHKRWEEKCGPAIVDSRGRPARLYPIVRQLNGEIAKLGPTLLRLTSTGVFHTGPTPSGARRLGSDGPVRAADDVSLVIGLFRDEHDTDYAMVVNRDYAKAVDAPLTFRPHVKALAVLDPADGAEREIALSDSRATLHLEPGDGRLLRLATEFQYPEPPEELDAIDFQFNRDGDMEGWEAFRSIDAAKVNDGVLQARIIGPDPHCSRRYLRVAPDRYTRIRLRMKLPPCRAEAQLFWTTSEEPEFDDDKYVNFAVMRDGEWHDYEVSVGKHDKWSGHTIRAIRLDPTVGDAEPGSPFEIDWIMGK